MINKIKNNKKPRVEINNKLSINGYIDNRYTWDSDGTDKFNFDSNLDILPSNGNVSGKLSLNIKPDSATRTDSTNSFIPIELNEGYTNYSLDNGITVAAGIFNIFEPFYSTNPDSLYTASTSRASDILADKKINGIIFSYSSGTFTIILNIGNSSTYNYGFDNNGSLATKLNISYTGIKNLWFTYTHSNNLTIDSSYNKMEYVNIINANYRVGKGLINQRWSQVKYSGDNKKYNLFETILDYDINNQLGGALRYEVGDIGDSTYSATGIKDLTFSLNYAITDLYYSLNSVIDFKHVKDSSNSSNQTTIGTSYIF